VLPVAEAYQPPEETGAPLTIGRSRRKQVPRSPSLEASGLRCNMGPMGRTIEVETVEEVYAALAWAQVAIFELGAGRAYTVVKGGGS
jgi:uncharacterized protein YqgV (UPF0045/DUF77 family)